MATLCAGRIYHNQVTNLNQNVHLSGENLKNVSKFLLDQIYINSRDRVRVRVCTRWIDARFQHTIGAAPSLCMVHKYPLEESRCLKEAHEPRWIWRRWRPPMRLQSLNFERTAVYIIPKWFLWIIGVDFFHGHIFFLNGHTYIHTYRASNEPTTNNTPTPNDQSTSVPTCKCTDADAQHVSLAFACVAVAPTGVW